MLFHVTMTHSADNCPAYHSEKMPAMIASLDALETLGKELNVKAHALVWGAPEHVAFAILEADTVSALTFYLNSIAMVQEFKITPVQNVADLVALAKAMMERANK